jgi:hypothetical protein
MKTSTASRDVTGITYLLLAGIIRERREGVQTRRSTVEQTAQARGAGGSSTFAASGSIRAAAASRTIGTVITRTRAIALGTLTVGTADAIDAVIFFGLRGARPVRIFQGIAGGLLGSAATRGGLLTAALGLAIHYVIAFGIVLTYNVASRRIDVLTKHPVVCGAIYGLLVYAFMNNVVIPLSAIGSQPFPRLAPLLNGLFIHMLGIGIPSALFAAAARPQSPASPLR